MGVVAPGEKKEKIINISKPRIPEKLTALQPYSLTALQPYSLTVLEPYSLTRKFPPSWSCLVTELKTTDFYRREFSTK